MSIKEHSVLNDRYELVEIIGSGGMATVYKGVDLMLDRFVAVKILKENLSKDLELRDRFHHEAKSVAKLSHPNIVSVYDFGLAQERLFIVQEYLQGIDLKSLLKKTGKLSVSDSLRIFKQACYGVSHAHQAGLVHCDLKPQNLLVSKNLKLKVFDFGVARALSSISADEKSKVVWGSPHYFSPEQASGNAPSPSSDVYSLGIILFEMLTGTLPFDHPETTELIKMHKYQPPPLPSSIVDDLDPRIDAFFSKALAKQSSYRYQNASDLLIDIKSLSKSPEIKSDLSVINIDSSPSQITPTSTSQKEAIAVESKIEWTTLVLVILTAIVVLGLIPFILWVIQQVNLIP